MASKLLTAENVILHICCNDFRYERALCQMRARMASTALIMTDRYFVASDLMRDSCEMSDSWLGNWIRCAGWAE